MAFARCRPAILSFNKRVLKSGVNVCKRVCYRLDPWNQLKIYLGFKYIVL